MQASFQESFFPVFDKRFAFSSTSLQLGAFVQEEV